MMHIGIHSSTAQYIAVLMLLMFIVGFAMSAGPLIWVLCSEIQPLKGRDFGITCSTATNWIANMIVGATFLTMLNSLGSANTFWVYGGLNVLFILLTLWLMPETKNVSLEHIERNLMQGRPLREIGAAINLPELPPIPGGSFLLLSPSAALSSGAMKTPRIPIAIQQAVMRSLREHLANANRKLERRYAEPTLVYLQRGTSAGTAWLRKRNSFKPGAAAGKSA